jgi:hypothetical protein
VRASAFEGPDAAAPVIEALQGVAGVGTVTHNPRTGSVLVEYQPGLADAETILERIAHASGLGMPSDDIRTRVREPAVVAIDATKELNEIVYELTGERADLRTLIPVGMAALAAYSWVNHPDVRFPRWDNLLYWSYNIFAQLHRKEIDRPRDGVSTEARPERP